MSVSLGYRVREALDSPRLLHEALHSGRGERLWTIQPDYILQGTRPVQWVADGPQHIWLNTSLAGLGLYDGHGRMVKTLDRICKLWSGLTPADVRSITLRREPEGRDLLGVRVGDTLHLFGPAR